LLAVVERDLTESAKDVLGADWRMNIAYNAALQAATLALAACGYRATRNQHHYRVLQSLRLTIDVDEGVVAALEVFRKKRNLTGYERAGLVSETDALEMHRLAVMLRDRVTTWLARSHRLLLDS
jgi:hypothetical protein